MINNNLKELQEDFPKILYKFRYFDKEGYHLKILTDNEIFFASLGRFNDPFDCHIPVRYDFGTRDQKIRHFEKHIERKNPSLNSKDRHREAKKLFKKNNLSNREEIKKITDNFVNNMIGIFSLSANYSNILSWSHYSDSHSGFCIGFDSLTLWNFCINYFSEFNKRLAIFEVRYSEKYPVINPYKMEPIEWAETQLQTKSKVWDYEEEYRMILQEGANVKMKLPEEAIRRVIIGCQIKQGDFDNLISIIKKRSKKVSVFKAETSQDEFKLKFNRVRM